METVSSCTGVLAALAGGVVWAWAWTCRASALSVIIRAAERRESGVAEVWFMGWWAAGVCEWSVAQVWLWSGAA